MVNRGSLVVVLSIALVQRAAAVGSAVWLQQTSLANLRANTSTLGEVTCRSKLQCSSVCIATPNCVSFFYGPLQKKCQLQNVVFTSPLDLIPVVQALYFVNGNFISGTSTPVASSTPPPTLPPPPQSTTTLAPSSPPPPTTLPPSTPPPPTTNPTTPPPSTPYPPFSCPLNNDIFRTVTLSDGSALSYRVFTTPLPHAESIASCAAMNSTRLIPVLTIPVQQLMEQLTACAGFSDYYWIDGAESAPNLLDFTTEANFLLPNVTEYWATDYPRAGPAAILTCVRLDLDFQSKWTNVDCTWPQPYICEQKVV